MLRALSIRDFVLVESLELEFGRGMTVLTGETGAGKSILVDALSLVLGDRAESGVVRKGAKRAEISAEFDIDALPLIQQRLNELGVETEVCLLRRVVEAEGRSRAFINGTPVTLTQIRDLAEELVDIHGQHAHHALLKPAIQRELLDVFAGAREQVAAVARAWKDWRQAGEAYRLAHTAEAASLQEKAMLESSLEEVTPVLEDLRNWETILAEHQRQSHMAALIESSAAVLDALDNDETGVLRQLNALQSLLQHMLETDVSLATLSPLLETAQSNLEEFRLDLNRYADRLNPDPESMAGLDARMAEVMRLTRKYRLSQTELLAQHQHWERRLTELEAGQDMDALKAHAEQTERDYLSAASALSVTRKQAAGELASAVMQTMRELALQDGSFEVRLTACEAQIHGKEEVHFMVSSHASLAPDVLEKVASGGELSRISLAIQTALSGRAGVPTLLFDEVDVGIGGAVADAVGRNLALVAANRQILVVTHLPQVAAWGSQHYRVSKLSGEDRVISQVAMLAGEERVHEIARMLGGQELTATTLQHAREMLVSTSSGQAAENRQSA